MTTITVSAMEVAPGHCCGYGYWCIEMTEESRKEDFARDGPQL